MSEKLGSKSKNWVSEAKIGDEVQFSFSYLTFFPFCCVWAQLGNFWGTFFLFKFFWVDENFSVLGLFFYFFF
jgi:hypothetical protein